MKGEPGPPVFSVGRILTLGLNTFTELTRLKLFYFLLIFALLVIGSSFFMARLSFAEEFQMLKDIALGAMSIFTALIAILATAMLIPKDLEDRTIYTVLAKPVPRYEYLLGKLVGIFFLLAVAVGVMTVLFLAVLWFRENAVIQAATAEVSESEELQAFIASVQEATFNVNLLPGIILILMKATLLAALTLFVSTFASTSLFTMFIAIAMYLIGHLQATAREFWLEGATTEWWSKALLAIVALVFPDLQAFSLNDEVVVGLAVPMALFLQTLLLGVFYVAVYYALAVFVFSNREL